MPNDAIPDWARIEAKNAVNGTMAQASPLFIERVSKALAAAERRGLERNPAQTLALAELDTALCQFLNNASDEYDPRLWVPSIERDFRRLSAAYNKCHAAGVMDLGESAAAIRKLMESSDET